MLSSQAPAGASTRRSRSGNRRSLLTSRTSKWPEYSLAQQPRFGRRDPSLRDHHSLGVQLTIPRDPVAMIESKRFSRCGGHLWFVGLEPVNTLLRTNQMVPRPPRLTPSHLNL